jgi:hypothetical protein
MRSPIHMWSEKGRIRMQGRKVSESIMQPDAGRSAGGISFRATFSGDSDSPTFYSWRLQGHTCVRDWDNEVRYLRGMLHSFIVC